jgi:hypothetical protein
MRKARDPIPPRLHSPVTAKTRTARGAGALLLVAVLAACGGGGGGGGDDDGGGNPPDGNLATGVASLAGDWLARTCVPSGAAASVRQHIRVTRANDNAISYDHTFVTYASTNCSGTGTVGAIRSPQGTVTFSRHESNTTAAANWGTWVLPNGVQSGAVWGKKGSDTALCIGATDLAFTGMNTLAAVSAWMNLSDATCYDKQ